MLAGIAFIAFWGVLTAAAIAQQQHAHPERYTAEAVARRYAKVDIDTTEESE